MRPRGRCAASGGATGRTPISVLVANFDRRGLTHDEVETLFHEFGHILHGVLSEADLQLPRRHERAARLRRNAVADLRGMGATPRKPAAHGRGVARDAGDGCGPRRAAERRAALRKGPALRPAMAVRVVRSRAHRRSARRRAAGLEEDGRRLARSATSPTPPSPAPSATSSAATPPGTTATCGPR